MNICTDFYSEYIDLYPHQNNESFSLPFILASSCCCLYIPFLSPFWSRTSEDQKADDQLANFLFLYQAYKQYKAGSYTIQRELLCLGNNALYLRNNALTPNSLVS
jgi:hypothetical protein